MKSKITVILAMLLLITLSGCNNTRQKENIPEPFSSSESSEQLYGQETLPAEETSEVETSPEASENAEPEETQRITEAESTDSSKPKAEQTASTVSAPQGGQKQETERETAQTTPPETQTPPPAQTEAVESTEVTEITPPQEVTPEPKSIYDYEFDVEAIRQEMIAVGEGMGLTHTDGLTPDTASWAIPVTASADFQGENLKRRLTDYVQSMPGLITAYGGEPIQSFTIYAEPLGGGSYRFYFLY